MALTNVYNFEFLKNGAEELVLGELEKQLAEYDDLRYMPEEDEAETKSTKKRVCKCNDCVMDMAAYALNNVKPLYHCTVLGEIYNNAARENKEYLKGIDAAVATAIKKIADNPSHTL
jgi:competence protein ComFB